MDSEWDSSSLSSDDSDIEDFLFNDGVDHLILVHLVQELEEKKKKNIEDRR